MEKREKTTKTVLLACVRNGLNSKDKETGGTPAWAGSTDTEEESWKKATIVKYYYN